MLATIVNATCALLVFRAECKDLEKSIQERQEYYLEMDRMRDRMRKEEMGTGPPNSEREEVTEEERIHIAKAEIAVEKEMARMDKLLDEMEGKVWYNGKWIEKKGG